MSKLELSVTEGIDPREAEALSRKLRMYLNVDEPYTIFRKSADPSLSQYIQIIGEVGQWSVLFYAAKILLDGAKAFLKSYLTTLGKRAGDATWEGLAGLFRSKGVKPLADVATALGDAQKAGGGHIDIVVGLTIPDRHFETAMTIRADSPEEVALTLALFVTHAEELSTVMKAEFEGDRAPVGQAIVRIENDGGLTVRWLGRDFAQHEKRLP
jgi:hypothetical protein